MHHTCIIDLNISWPFAHLFRCPSLFVGACEPIYKTIHKHYTNLCNLCRWSHWVLKYLQCFCPSKLQYFTTKWVCVLLCSWLVKWGCVNCDRDHSNHFLKKTCFQIEPTHICSTFAAYPFPLLWLTLWSVVVDKYFMKCINVAYNIPPNALLKPSQHFRGSVANTTYTLT